ncbi:MAG: M48 family metalloprotease [Novosphingobium sp.]
MNSHLHPKAAKKPARGRKTILAPHALAAILAMTWAALAFPAAAADDATFENVRAADTVIARIGYRLATANASLCDRLQPGLGLVLQTPGQYESGVREEAIRHFHMDGPISVEAVLPDSPAAAAGIKADDTILSMGTVQFAPADASAKASTRRLIAATARIAALPADAPMEIRGRRNGVDYVRTVKPVPACRTRFEMQISSGFSAQSDGEMVQVSSRFFTDYPEDQAASVLAHEFAHNILHHRERMEKMGLSFGMLSGFGRNVRYFRETELQADILSISLLANAGYDPEAAVRLWRAFGPSHAGGILLSRSHPAWKDRVATMEKAIADLGTRRPNHPAVLATLDKPLDGDWKALLVKAR